MAEFVDYCALKWNCISSHQQCNPPVSHFFSSCPTTNVTLNLTISNFSFSLSCIFLTRLLMLCCPLSLSLDSISMTSADKLLNVWVTLYTNCRYFGKSYAGAVWRYSLKPLQQAKKTKPKEIKKFKKPRN